MDVIDDEPTVVLPGQVIEQNPSDTAQCASGAYFGKSGEVRSCQAGMVMIANENNTTVYSVIVPTQSTSSNGLETRDIAICVGDICYCRVTKIMQNQGKLYYAHFYLYLLR